MLELGEASSTDVIRKTSRMPVRGAFAACLDGPGAAAPDGAYKPFGTEQRVPTGLFSVVFLGAEFVKTRAGGLGGSH